MRANDFIVLGLIVYAALFLRLFFAFSGSLKGLVDDHKETMRGFAERKAERLRKYPNLFTDDGTNHDARTN